MKSNIKLPYGLSNFESLIREGYTFFDSTQYIEKLENYPKKYIAFLRPRKFGKSLFISMLGYYYDIKQKNKFQELFGNLYIGKNITINASKYMVLTLDFSGINTDTHESTFIGFKEKIYLSIMSFGIRYGIYSENMIDKLFTLESADKIIENLFETLQSKGITEKIYLLIDEYDHFANEILSFRYSDYLNSVGKNGFIRKFFEVIKTGTRNGVVDRIFITGVSPITLDSLTSGFNIATNLTLDKEFHSMLGFQKAQIENLLNEIQKNCKKMNKEEIMNTLQKYYNGYLFNEESPNRLYNPNMTLYYLSEYIRECTPPKDLLDENIMSDYSKIKQMFNIGNIGKNLETLKLIVTNRSVQGELTKKFNLESEEFDDNNLISLLFYLGILTIKEGKGDEYIFQMPNYIIEKLYLKYFDSLITKESMINYKYEDKKRALMQLIFENNIGNILHIISESIKGLSTRNFIGTNERTIQLLVYSFLNLTEMYYIQSEYEVEQKFIDIIMMLRAPYQAPNQFIFKIKYLKKSEKKKLKTVITEGETQLREYLHLNEIKNLTGIKGYLIVFIGEKYEYREIC